MDIGIVLSLFLILLCLGVFFWAVGIIATAFLDHSVTQTTHSESQPDE